MRSHVLYTVPLPERSSIAWFQIGTRSDPPHSYHTARIVWYTTTPLSFGEVAVVPIPGSGYCIITLMNLCRVPVSQSYNIAAFIARHPARRMQSALCSTCDCPGSAGALGVAPQFILLLHRCPRRPSPWR
jgi:hypothetical protein